MNRLNKIKKIEKAGYKFTGLMNGQYMAVKGFIIVKGKSINAIYTQIFN